MTVIITDIGWEILRRIQEDHASIFTKFGMDIARHHHEKWDGTGYPDGLSGDSISLRSRIIAIVDVYDALRSLRPYKKAYTHDESMKIIIDGRNNHFDPYITDIFCENADAIKNIYDNYVHYEIEKDWGME